MSQFKFMGADLVGLSGAPTAGPIHYALFPMAGDRVANTAALVSTYYPIELTWPKVHSLWWQQQYIRAVVTLDWGGFIVTEPVDLQRKIGSGSTNLIDEKDLMLSANSYWQGYFGFGTAQQIRVQIILNNPDDPASTSPAYYWNTNDSDFLPRLFVVVEATWLDSGTTYGAYFDTVRTDLTDTGTAHWFTDGDFQLYGSGSPSATIDVTISDPPFSPYFPYNP